MTYCHIPEGPRFKAKLEGTALGSEGFMNPGKFLAKPFGLPKACARDSLEPPGMQKDFQYDFRALRRFPLGFPIGFASISQVSTRVFNGMSMDFLGGTHKGFHWNS